MGRLRCLLLGVALVLLISSACCKVADDLLPATTSGVTAPVPNGFLCRVCGVFLDILDEVLKDTKVEKWLVHFVQKHVCPRVPTDKAREECVEKAPTVVPAIINWVEEIANMAMCSELHICGPIAMYEAPLEAEHHHHHNNDRRCMVCKKAAEFAKEAAQKVQPDSLVARIEELRQMCSQLSDEDAVRECMQIVDRYGYLLVYFVEKEQHIDVRRACSDIGLCQRHSPEPVIDPFPETLVTRMASYGARSSNDQDQCSKCKAIAGAAHGGLDDPQTRKEVIDYVSRPCRWIPLFSKRCRETIGNLTLEAVTAVSGSVTPEAACDALHYCDEAAVSRPEGDGVEWKTTDGAVYVQ